MIRVNQYKAFACLLVLALCANSEMGELQNAEAADVPGEFGSAQGEQKWSIEELARLYGAAKAEQERRDICFRAIDSGWIRRGGPLSQLDAILGTHLVTKPKPGRESDLLRDMIYFRAEPEGARDRTRTRSRSKSLQSGWYLVVVYDLVAPEPKVQDYHISNVRKRLSHFCKSARN